jgi:DNA-binding NtrC family response regulator
VRHFVARYSHEMRRPEIYVEPDAVDILKAHPWPGNVRELQNVIKRALTLARGDSLTPDDLPDEIATRAGDGANRHDGFFGARAEVVAAFEAEYLTKLLRAHGGDAAAAARSAQLPLGTLYRLLKRNRLTAESFRA